MYTVQVRMTDGWEDRIVTPFRSPTFDRLEDAIDAAEKTALVWSHRSVRIIIKPATVWQNGVLR